VARLFFLIGHIQNTTVAHVNNAHTGDAKMVNRTLYLYHITHKNNWMSIGVQGILASYSQGKVSASWLVKKSKIEWAASKVSQREGWKEKDLIVVRVRVRRSWLRKNKIRGAYYCPVDIHPCRIEFIKAYPPVGFSIRSRGNKQRFLKDTQL